MAWQVAPHARFCVASGRVIFLDIARDRYFALPLDQSHAFQAWIEGVPPAPVPPIIERLHRAGLVEAVERGAPAFPMEILPATCALAAAKVPPRLGSVLDVAFSFLRVRVALKRRGLMQTLDWLRPTAEETSEDATLRHAAVFRSNRGALPMAVSCLPDSLAMLDYLGRRGVHASIVFGVTGTPFRAHCWVQLGDQVLNDVLDNITPFTPILQR
ncbi:MAG: lasso peptide biosynthesis B2 protein [Sphingomonas sp.]